MTATLVRLQRLAATVKSCDEHTHDAIEARNNAIMDADTEGLSVRTIAKAAGLSRGQIQRVVLELTEQRQAAAVHALGLEAD